ncbi:MAG: hypothetical protein RL757_1479 [Bacteroidota bacterium]
MEKNPKIGGLGVKMVDGSGVFLPESKRGFPSPWVAFCKVFGLSAIFPRSKRFNEYHLGHLSAEENNPIEVLAGAFMMMPRRVIDEIGLLDETFFMYGEDIDWSYRISKAGYENAYFADTTIVHYKGESTKKGSLNYVKIFYNAMIIFAQKHFTGEKARFYILLMRFAIYFRALLTLISTTFVRLKIPFLDAFLTASGLFFLKNVWAKNYFDDPNYFSQRFIYFNIPLYVSIWILSIFLSGGYDVPLSLRRVWRGGVLGTVLLAAIYGFLPSDVRFSRAILVLGSVWMLLAVTALRYFIHFLKYKTLKIDDDVPNNIIVIGDVLENERVQKLLSHRWNVRKNMIGLVAPTPTTDFKKFLGNVEDLTKICQLYDVKELIFCSADIKNKTIIEKMVELRRDTGGGLDFKILPPESESIIGSSDKNARGELYTLDVEYRLAAPLHRRNKRIFDIGAAIFLLLLSPILLFFQQHILIFFKHIFQVLWGQKTWLGYKKQLFARENSSKLPKLSPSVFSSADLAMELSPENLATETIERLNFLYARDFDIWNDVALLFQKWRQIGDLK